MANLRDIRRRIKSVKNTAQITKAMQLVAASKMKKAQDQAMCGRPYADLLNDVLVNLKEQTSEEDHPLLKENQGEKELVILVSTDKGLCGGLNTNLFRVLTDNGHDDADYVTIGRKGAQFLARSKKELLADFKIDDPVSFLASKQISEFATEKFLSGDYARVRVAFTNFVNTMTQLPMIETLLPISPIDLGRDKDFVGMGAGQETEATNLPEDPRTEYGGYIFEPTPSAVLETTVPQYVNYQLYQMILESRASEHSARMVAMKAATDNANEMIKDLTLDYNKQRQAAITAELLEITTAMRALE